MAVWFTGGAHQLADGHLQNLNAIQRSALKLLHKQEQVDPPLPSLDSRRQATAVGLACKLLDGKGRRLLNELGPVFVDPIQPPPTIVSARIAAARTGGPPRHPHQLTWKIEPFSLFSGMVFWANMV